MQRRAAAIYVALFIVIGAASYSLVATAEAPHIEFQNPEYELTSGDTFEAGSQTYNVQEITAQMQGGGHGGSASLARSGTLNYTNQTARYTVTWENNSTVTLDDTEWRVLTTGEENDTRFTLREDINESVLLQEDPNAADELARYNGSSWVVVRENGSERLVAPDNYFPEPESRTYEQGDTLPYEGNETTITSMSPDAVELAWNAPRTVTVDVANEGNVTLGDRTYLAYFPDNSTLQLTTDFESYRAQTEEIDTFHTHESGLWGVSILSFLTAVFLIGLAYMPSRY